MEKRKRISGDHEPLAKRPSLALDEQRARSDLKTLFSQYQALYAAPSEGADESAFQALLDAAQGSPACRRLAARLIPRFIPKYPSRADTAAAILIDLHDGRGGPGSTPSGSATARAGRHLPGTSASAASGGGGAGAGGSAPELEEAARRDALSGLAPVLRAAAGLPPQQADACVARVLDHLTRLLGELSGDGGGGDGEFEAEEGEVDEKASLLALARAAFTHHTRRVLAFCVGCLAKPERAAGAACGERDARRGARLVISRVAMRPPPKAARERLARAANGGGGADGGGGGGGGECWLALALRADEGLQAWVAQAAAAASAVGRAPSEARQILEQFVQLLPPPPLPDSPPPGSPPHGKPPPGAGGAGPQQQGRPAAVNGGGGMPRNGMAPLQRAGSGSIASGGPPPPRTPAREPRSSFPPAPAGHVARVEPCLLVWGLPRHVAAAALLQATGAREAWLLDGPGGDEGCLTFESVQEAARCYQRLNGEAPFGEPPPLDPAWQQHRHPPGRLRLEFCSSLPPASALNGRLPLSPFVWVSAATGADAGSLPAIVAAQGQVAHVTQLVRIGGKAPGTLLHAASAAAAQQVVDALARRLPPPPAAAQHAQHAPPHAGGGAAQQHGPGSPWAGGPPPQDAPGGGTPHHARFGGPGADPSPGGPRLPPAAAGSPPRGGPGAGGGGPGAPGGPPQVCLAVCGIPRDATEPEFMSVFGAFGRIVEHRFVRGGDGHVTYLEPAAAARACDALQGRRLGGAGNAPVRVDWAAARWPGAGGTPGGRPGGPGAPSPAHMRTPGWDRGGEQQPPHMATGSAQRQGSGDWDGRGGGGGWQAADRGGAPPLPPDWGGSGDGPARGGGLPPPPLPGQQPPPLPPGHPPLPHPPKGAAMPSPAGGRGPPPGWPPAPPRWQGRLSKSKSVQCSLVCIDAGAPGAGARAEPAAWPAELSVLNRSRIGDVLDAYRATPPHLRGVLRLLAAGGPGSPDDAGLAGFIEYLRSKDRAGLVKLPRGGGVPHARDLHLVVPEEGVLRELGVPPPRPGERALVAVVTPGRDDGPPPGR